MSSIEILGMIAGGLTTSSFLPQVIKIWKTKSAKDISLLMSVMFSIGVLCWLIYGLAINSLSIILANGTVLILSLLILYFKLKF